MQMWIIPSCEGARRSSAASSGLRRAWRGLGFAVLGSAAVLFMRAPALAAEGQALGRYLALECSSCHQLSGASVGGIPSIVGWPEAQFVAVLDAYRRKEREGQVMQAVAARLSRAEMVALAAYFGTLSPKP
jgi:cytochrome c553